jgi:predicted exporter
MKPLVRLRALRVVLALVLTATLIGAIFSVSQFKVDTDLQALFPADPDNFSVNRANSALYSAFADQVVVGVEAPSRERALAAADWLEGEVSRSSLWNMAHASDHAERLLAQQHLLTTHRYQLLTPSQIDALRYQPDNVLTNAQYALFGFSTGGAAVLDDPLALVPGVLATLPPAVNGDVQGDRLVFGDAEGHVILLTAKATAPTSQLTTQAAVATWVTTIKADLAKQFPDATLLVSGAVFHAGEASANAKREVNVIGLGTLIGLIVLFLLAFRGVKPLLLSLLSVGVGCGIALVATSLIFGRIHIMTLVFGASLIGVAVDYSLHYLCKFQALKTVDSASRIATFQSLAPILTLSVVTSMLGYSCLFQASLPGLQQIACFSLIGLAGAWLWVLAMYPALLKAPLAPTHWLIDRIAFAPWNLWQRCRAVPLRWMAAIWLVTILFAASLATISEDVRTFYKPSPPLLASEMRLQQVMQGVSVNQYMVVRGVSEDDVLMREEALRAQLAPLISQGALAGYTATSVWVPSTATQTANRQLLVDQVYGSDGLAAQFMTSAGFDAAAVVDAQQRFHHDATPALTVENWLAVARPDQAVLWVGEQDGEWMSVVGLRGVKDTAALAAAATAAQVLWVDRVRDISDLLGELFVQSALMLGLAYGVIMVLLWVVFRRVKAMGLVCLPIVTSLTIMAVLAYAGIPLNIFHLFGAFLILGLGMDYALFAYANGIHDRVSQRAIALSVITSALSFGLLALSSTPMVHAFGVTLLAGCCLNVLFAPLISRLCADPHKESAHVA